MGNTDYDRGWEAGYYGYNAEPPTSIANKEEWRNGYSDGVSQFNIDQDAYWDDSGDEMIDWVW